MTYQDKIFFALYQLNLSQLAMGATLESIIGILVKNGNLEAEISASLARHLLSIDRNCDRTTEAIFSIIQSHQTRKSVKPVVYADVFDRITPLMATSRKRKSQGTNPK